jgi:hypothetical protein
MFSVAAAQKMSDRGDQSRQSSVCQSAGSTFLSSELELKFLRKPMIVVSCAREPQGNQTVGRTAGRKGQRPGLLAQSQFFLAWELRGSDRGAALSLLW